MNWFLVAAELSLKVVSGELGTHLLARLFSLSRFDGLKMEQLKLQIAEYMKAYPEKVTDHIVALHLKLRNM
jgi:hypothetical protein